MPVGSQLREQLDHEALLEGRKQTRSGPQLHSVDRSDDSNASQSIRGCELRCMCVELSSNMC